MSKNEAEPNHGPSKGHPLSSKLPPSVRSELCQIANLHWPSEWHVLINLEKATEKNWQENSGSYLKRDAPKLAELHGEYRKRMLLPLAKKATKEIWPELWQPIKEDESVLETEERALWMLFKMRSLLHQFWSHKDPHARAWYIHRARELYQTHYVLPKMSQAWAERDEAIEQAKKATEQLQQAIDNMCGAFSRVNTTIEQLLNEPPEPKGLEAALFKLQKRAEDRSRAPAKCQNKKCIHPYFLKDKTVRVYCSSRCYREHKLSKGRTDWHEKYKKKRERSKAK